jgi:hypothetical protein
MTAQGQLYESRPSNSDQNFDEGIARVPTTDVIDVSSVGAQIGTGRSMQDEATEKCVRTDSNRKNQFSRLL